MGCVPFRAISADAQSGLPAFLIGAFCLRRLDGTGVDAGGSAGWRSVRDGSRTSSQTSGGAGGPGLAAVFLFARVSGEASRAQIFRRECADAQAPPQFGIISE